MRGKRAKQYRKLMHQYALAFAFREPYQVLLDAAIIKDAAHFKMRLGAMLAGTLHGAIKPMITQCCIRHLYDDESAPAREKQEWIAVAKQAERRRCGHHERERPLDALACIASVVDPKGGGVNRHRYVVASQDVAVRRAMRAVAGVPLVYIARSVMILEPMAQRTEEVRERDEMGKIRAGLIGGRRGGADGALAAKRKREEGDVGEEGEDGAGLASGRRTDEPKKKKVRGPKGPNPLSMMKSKKDKSKLAITEKGEGGKAAPRTTTDPDPQTEVQSPHADSADLPDLSEIVDGQRKRKRKRKPRETAAVTETEPFSDDGDI